jgi:hypothetical protein
MKPHTGIDMKFADKSTADVVAAVGENLNVRESIMSDPSLAVRRTSNALPKSAAVNAPDNVAVDPLSVKVTPAAENGSKVQDVGVTVEADVNRNVTLTAPVALIGTEVFSILFSAFSVASSSLPV